MNREDFVAALLAMNGDEVLRGAKRLDDGKGGVTPGWPTIDSPWQDFHLRSVMWNETVFDVGDNTKWPVAARNATILHETLAWLGAPHQVALSAGRGIHIHLWHQPHPWAEDDEWRWRIASTIIEYAAQRSGVYDLDVDYRLIAPRPGSRLVREYGARKSLDSHYKTLWCDWPSEEWRPLPATAEAAYNTTSRRLRLPTPADISHLDLGWTDAVGAHACPRRPSCLSDFLACTDCPLGA